MPLISTDLSTQLNTYFSSLDKTATDKLFSSNFISKLTDYIKSTTCVIATATGAYGAANLTYVGAGSGTIDDFNSDDTFLIPAVAVSPELSKDCYDICSEVTKGSVSGTISYTDENDAKQTESVDKITFDDLSDKCKEYVDKGYKDLKFDVSSDFDDNKWIDDIIDAIDSYWTKSDLVSVDTSGTVTNSANGATASGNQTMVGTPAPLPSTPTIILGLELFKQSMHTPLSTKVDQCSLFCTNLASALTTYLTTSLTSTRGQSFATIAGAGIFT